MMKATDTSAPGAASSTSPSSAHVSPQAGHSGNPPLSILAEQSEGSDDDFDTNMSPNIIYGFSSSSPTSTLGDSLHRPRVLNARGRGKSCESDPSYHFSDEDTTMHDFNSEFPLDQLYSWVQSIQMHEKKNEELLGQLHSEAKRHQTLRLSVLILCGVTVFLSVTNIGTSLAAARLAQETRVDHNDLTNLHGVRLGTTSKEISVQMAPWDERRELQVDSNDSNGMFCNTVPGKAICQIEGTIDSENALKIYEAFCPGFSETGECSGDGVEKINLNCNGRISTLFGGVRLPPDPPTDIGGFIAYPTAGHGYVGRASVYLFGRLLPCVQEFTVGIYCPTDGGSLFANNGAISDECMVFLAWEPGACLGRVELCGPYYPSSV